MLLRTTALGEGDPHTMITAYCDSVYASLVVENYVGGSLELIGSFKQLLSSGMFGMLICVCVTYSVCIMCRSECMMNV
jgi:hypothetical protein